MQLIKGIKRQYSANIIPGWLTTDTIARMRPAIAPAGRVTKVHQESKGQDTQDNRQISENSL